MGGQVCTFEHDTAAIVESQRLDMGEEFRKAVVILRFAGCQVHGTRLGRGIDVTNLN